MTERERVERNLRIARKLTVAMVAIIIVTDIIFFIMAMYLGLKGEVGIEVLSLWLLISVAITGLSIVIWSSYKNLEKGADLYLRNVRLRWHIAEMYHLKVNEFVEIMVRDENDDISTKSEMLENSMKFYAKLLVSNDEITGIEVIAEDDETDLEFGIIGDLNYFQAKYEPKKLKLHSFKEQE